MNWDRRDGHRPEVAERGGWCELEQLGVRFPDVAGVYVFAGGSLQVRYVGSAGLRRLREEAIRARGSRLRSEGATRATWLATSSGEDATSLGAILIAKYRPPNNRRVEPATEESLE